MADENTTIRIKDQPEDSVLANGDYVVVDSQAEGTRKFNLGKEIRDIKEDLTELQEEIEGGGGGGMSADFKQALHNILEKVAFVDEYGQTYLDALDSAMYPPVTAISLNTNSLSFATLNSTQQLTATTTPSGGAVTWSSSNTSIATVSSSGLVTSVGYGSAIITATSGSVSATCSVLVSQATLSSISAVYTQSGTVYDSDSLDSLKSDLVVTAHWSNSTTTTVPSDEYTLSGTLTAGTSTVTVSYGGQTTTFTVTVTAKVLLYHWDFTGETPLVDKVASQTITTSGTVNTDSTNGLSFGTASSYCSLGLTGNDMKGKEVEVKFGDMVTTTSASTHQRLITSNQQYGLICRKDSHKWAIYGSVNGSNTWQETSVSQNGVANKTFKMVINSATDVDIYLDGTLVLENAGLQLDTTANSFRIGSNSNSCTITYIKSLKIYEG